MSRHGLRRDEAAAKPAAGRDAREDAGAQNSGPGGTGENGGGQPRTVCYRVKQLCRIGRLFEVGDVFESEPIEPCPDHLEPVTGPAAGRIPGNKEARANTVKKPSAPVAYAGMSPADVFGASR